MPLPFSWDVTKPAGTDALRLGDDQIRTDKTTLRDILPLTDKGAGATLGWRTQQFGNVVWTTYNAGSTDGTTWNRDDTASRSFAIRRNADGSVEYLEAGAGANPITWNTVWKYDPATSVFSHTGSIRIGGDVELLRGAADRLDVLDQVQITGVAGLGLTFATDNAVDIGASGANRPRNLFLGRTLSIAQGTLTGDTPAIDIAASWNNSAIAFAAIKANITDIASASGSLLADLQVGGTSRFKVDKAGSVGAGGVTPLADNTYDLGTSALRWRDLYLSGLASNGGPRFRHKRSMVAVSRSVAQSIPPNTWTAISWDVEDFDTDNLHDTATNPTRLVAPYAGKYLLTAAAQFSTGGLTKYMRVLRSGVNVLGRGSGGLTAASISVVVNMAANDYVEVQVLHGETSGSSVLGNDTDNRITHAEWVYLGE